MTPMTKVGMQNALDRAQKRLVNDEVNEWFVADHLDLDTTYPLWYIPGKFQIRISGSSPGAKWLKWPECEVSRKMGGSTVKWMALRQTDYMPIYNGDTK